MIKEIKDGFAASVHEAFPKSKIFDETMQQGIIPKCFLITVISPSRQTGIAQKHQYDVWIVAQYFPSSREKKNELYQVIDILSACTEVIRIPTGTLEKEMYIRRIAEEYSIASDVLTYKAHYVVNAYKPAEGDAMNNAKIGTIIKE